MKKSVEYIKNIQTIIEKLLAEEIEKIDACAELFSKTLQKNRNIFLFGTGHSHMLCEEIFYRAGGLVKIQPIFEESLMLHESASKSSQIERLTGYAEILSEHYDFAKDDLIVLVSNSGRNGVCVDMAQIAKDKGMKIIVITNMNHTTIGASRHPSGKKLYEFGDVVIDNLGCHGDASIEIDNFERKVAPTSTVVGATVMNAIVAQCVQNMVDDGFTPEVFASSNIDGGDEINSSFIKKYKGEIKSL